MGDFNPQETDLVGFPDKKELKKFLAKQLNELLEMHHIIETLDEGVNVFLLRGKHRNCNYEVRIEAVKDKIYGTNARTMIINDNWKNKI